MTKEKRNKKTNNDLQNITHKTKVRATRTSLKPGGELLTLILYVRHHKICLVWFMVFNANFNNISVI